MREPTFIAAVGMTGVGKTYENLKQIRNVLCGNPAKKVAPHKVLIIDNNAEYRNDNKDVREILGPYNFYIKTIHYKQVPEFTQQSKVECCRIVPFDEYGRALGAKQFGESLVFTLDNFRGGLIVAEDFKAYTGNSLSLELIGKLATRRHFSCDTLVSLQGANMIQPTLLMVLKWIRLHKSLDPLERGEKFKGKVQLLSIAQNLVDARYNMGGINERFFVKVELQRSAIYGMYSEAEFLTAAKKYIFENDTWKKRMKHRNEDTGKLIYTEQAAIQEEIREYTHLFSQYSQRNK